MHWREYPMRDRITEHAPTEIERQNNLIIRKLKSKFKARLQKSDLCNRDLIIAFIRQLDKVECQTSYRLETADGKWEFNKYVHSKSFTGWQGEYWGPNYVGFWPRTPPSFVDGVVLSLQE